MSIEITDPTSLTAETSQPRSRSAAPSSAVDRMSPSGWTIQITVTATAAATATVAPIVVAAAATPIDQPRARRRRMSGSSVAAVTIASTTGTATIGTETMIRMTRSPSAIVTRPRQLHCASRSSHPGIDQAPGSALARGTSAPRSSRTAMTEPVTARTNTVTGNAVISPRIPYSAAPAVIAITTIAGWTSTRRPIDVSASSRSSAMAAAATPTMNSSACSGPVTASRISAMAAVVTIAPRYGTRPATNTRATSGPSRGPRLLLPSTASRTAAATASAAAMITTRRT